MAFLCATSGALSLAACVPTTGGGGTGTGGGSGGGAVLSANFAKNVFLEANSTAADRAAFLSDSDALDDFFQNFTLPSSGQIEFYNPWSGSSVSIPHKYVVDFAAGTVTEWRVPAYTDNFTTKGNVFDFDRVTGEFADQLSSATRLRMTNIKMMFLPVLTGNSAAVIQDASSNGFGWETLTSEITMPKTMPTTGNASYSGNGIFDVRQTDLDGSGSPVSSSAVEFRGVSSDAAATVDFGGRTFHIDINNISTGPIGAMSVDGEFYDEQIGPSYYTFGQTDGVKPGNFKVMDQNGNVIWVNPFTDVTGDDDFINFVGPDASEIVGKIGAAFDTGGGTQRLEVDGVYIASED